MASYILRDVDPTFWRQFKMKATSHGISMREAILLSLKWFMREFKG